MLPMLSGEAVTLIFMRFSDCGLRLYSGPSPSRCQLLCLGTAFIHDVFVLSHGLVNLVDIQKKAQLVSNCPNSGIVANALGVSALFASFANCIKQRDTYILRMGCRRLPGCLPHYENDWPCLSTSCGLVIANNCNSGLSVHVCQPCSICCLRAFILCSQSSCVKSLPIP